MNPSNFEDPTEIDPYQQILFQGYGDREVAEIQTLLQKWHKATYPTIANSIVDHANRQGSKMIT